MTLSSVGLGLDSRVSSVAFNPLQRSQAAGTEDGSIAMWRFAGKYQHMCCDNGKNTGTTVNVYTFVVNFTHVNIGK